jgi:hypothetical protein
MKVHGTKKQIAQELWRRLQEGPHLSMFLAGFVGDIALPDLTPAQQEAINEQAMRQCRNWLASWIVGDVKKLVPREFWPPEDRKER